MKDYEKVVSKLHQGRPCLRCLSGWGQVPATTIFRIFDKSDHLKYDLRNLIPLCKDCAELCEISHDAIPISKAQYRQLANDSVKGVSGWLFLHWEGGTLESYHKAQIKFIKSFLN